eukprot:TRINITY_DN2050_c0_g1_i1.p1 TRINITY_DN2050_c0_g1~~TRINITY_DN2050_c0_g1_i1.p1  ORF type:complete len:50 (+),score=3.42 TRINITY_DN2050_c0_g1_i1:261-410(+)
MEHDFEHATTAVPRIRRGNKRSGHELGGKCGGMLELMAGLTGARFWLSA